MDILYEAGEAIGNVGRRVLRRKHRAQAEEALERWSARMPMPKISPKKDQTVAAGNIIDATYRILKNDQDTREGESR
jgi:predicted nucleic acid-binding protein